LRLSIEVSPDTLLRRLKCLTLAPITPPRLVGVDDWAFHRGHRYGTILVDLECRKVIDVLPDRQAETLAAWLRQYPSITLISRDRASAYAEGGFPRGPAGSAGRRSLASAEELARNGRTDTQSPSPCAALRALAVGQAIFPIVEQVDKSLPGRLQVRGVLLGRHVQIP
jgi:hypothetical protein